MATKNLNASELNPMSTIMLTLFMCMIGLVLFIFLLNPISMFLFHLFNPKFAAKLVHASFFCGNRICTFYTKLALKWPFKWSKWWVTEESLDRLTDAEQKLYYDEVSDSYETLCALRPDVWAQIVDKIPHSERLFQTLATRDDLFAALLVLPYEKHQFSKLLHCYMQNGTLPKSQMNQLVEKACSADTKNTFDPQTDELLDYIRRCGLSKELLNKIIENDTLSQSFREAVLTQHDFYLQRITAKRLYALSSKEELAEWKSICAQNKEICVDAQKEMSPALYKIFLQYGRHLDADAILYHLWNGEEKIAKMIFSNEPKFGIQNSKIQFALRKHLKLEMLFQRTIAETERNLWCDIREGKELDVKQLNVMFDCPAAEKMVFNYVTKWALPAEIQMRLFELPNAKEIFNFYAIAEAHGKECLTAEIRRMAEEKNFLPVKTNE